MGKLVATGGGDIAGGETFAIDRQVVFLAGKSRPRARFIPTASSDSRDYWKGFQGLYGQDLALPPTCFICSALTRPSRS